MTKEQIELIRKINEKQDERAELDVKIEELKQTGASLDSEIETLKASLLEGMKNESLEEYHDESSDLYATVMSRSNVGYTNDADVVKALKDNGFERYVRVKVTESIDKTPLKKALKEDEKLRELLSPMTVDSVTEYVVVTTKENHERMLEHIEEGKKKKN